MLPCVARLVSLERSPRLQSSRRDRCLEMQCDHLRLLYGDSEMTRDWCRILYVEIVVQWLFREKHGAFPEDQMAFTRNYFEEQTTLLIGNLPNVMIEHS